MLPALQIDALEARFGQAMGFRGGSREVLQQLAAQLAALEADLGSLPSGEEGAGREEQWAGGCGGCDL